MNIRYAVTRLVDEVVNSVNQENQIKLDAYNTAASQIQHQRKLMDAGEIDRVDVEEPEAPKLVKVKNAGKVVDQIVEQLESLLDSERADSMEGVEVEPAPKAEFNPKPAEGEGQTPGAPANPLEDNEPSGGTHRLPAEQNPSSADDSARGESRRGDIGNQAARSTGVASVTTRKTVSK